MTPTNCPHPCRLCMQAASCTYRIALGPRAGQKVLSLRTVAGRDEKTTAALCADAHGFSLHAGVRCGAHQRKELERLCRYITRPAIANERLTRDGAGDVVPQLKSAWRDGTTHIRMSPLEFMQRLAALVPRPRLHLIRFHGVLAPTPACVPRSCRAHRRNPAMMQTTMSTVHRRAWAGRACSTACSESTSNTARSAAATLRSSPPLKSLR